MERKKLKEDIIIYTLLLVLCGALYFWITPSNVDVNTNLVDDSTFTARTFPNLLTGAMAIATALGLITSIRKFVALPKPEEERVRKSRHDWVILAVPYLTFLIILVYAVLFEKLGYIWGTLIVPPILMFLFGCRKWYMYAGVYGFAALMYLLFKFVLYVPLR